MASGSITSWETDGETVETVRDFILGGSKITSLVAQTVKHLQCRRPGVQSLGWEDLLEKDIATYSRILAWKIPWMEEPGRVHEATKVSDTTEHPQLAFAA